MNKISVTIVAASENEFGDKIYSIEGVIPRIVLAELNTHRMLSKNSASSRAIPFNKMVEMVKTNPFIPIAWQKEHKGMQGSEYFTEPMDIKYLTETHFQGRDNAISVATLQSHKGLTKQLCNRYLEPFMYHKVLITSTEWENFFELRCPQYHINQLIDGDERIFRSKKDLLKELDYDPIFPSSEIEWLSINKGQAEIHIMDFAEKVWDAINECKPKKLKTGEWHIPYGDKIILPVETYDTFDTFNNKKIKVSTAMAARTSYTTVGDEKEISYEKLIGIHDKMAIQKPFHASPFEHCAQAMSKEEYQSFFRGQLSVHYNGDTDIEELDYVPPETQGWCRNYRGFIQYRHILEEQLK